MRSTWLSAEGAPALVSVLSVAARARRNSRWTLASNNSRRRNAKASLCAAANKCLPLCTFGKQSDISSHRMSLLCPTCAPGSVLVALGPPFLLYARRFAIKRGGWRKMAATRKLYRRRCLNSGPSPKPRHAYDRRGCLQGPTVPP